MGILTQSGRGFPIHVRKVGTYHYYWHAAMGEKIATQVPELQVQFWN